MLSANYCDCFECRRRTLLDAKEDDLRSRFVEVRLYRCSSRGVWHNHHTTAVPMLACYLMTCHVAEGAGFSGKNGDRTPACRGGNLLMNLGTARSNPGNYRIALGNIIAHLLVPGDCAAY